MSQDQRKRVVFFGIDGGAWRVIEPMVAAGKLPNLAAMMARGTRGVLEGTYPPNSSLAWASFMTGVHPGKHGVFFFREQRLSTYQRPVISFHSIKAPTIFKHASELGKKVVAVTVPLTYPVERWEGVQVGGLLTPDRNSDFIHPPELRDELERAVGDVPSDNEPEKLFHASGEAAAVESLHHVTEQITRMGEHLLETQDPDLFAIVFRGVDLACHQAWRYQDPEWVERNPDKVGGREGIVAEMYERLDAALGRIREKAEALDGQVVFGVCSDHGFGPITYRFYVNKWLADQGYLVLKPGAGRRRLGLWLARKWNGLLRRTGITKRRYLAGKEKFLGPEAAIMEMIDWSKTRAYSSFSGGEDVVLVNLKGREPEGIVEPGEEYERLRGEIIEKLKTVQAPDGTPICQAVYRREELWDGPQVFRAPDIQFITHDTSVNAGASPVHPRVVEPAYDGAPAMHRVDGIYLWEGDGVIRAGARHDGPQIADMAPTILHLLGLPVDDYMDGRVMEGCLTEAYRAENPVQVREGHVELKADLDDGGGISSEDEAKLVETMQALGYFE